MKQLYMLDLYRKQTEYSSLSKCTKENMCKGSFKINACIRVTQA